MKNTPEAPLLDAAPCAWGGKIQITPPVSLGRILARSRNDDRANQPLHQCPTINLCTMNFNCENTKNNSNLRLFEWKLTDFELNLMVRIIAALLNLQYHTAKHG